MIIRLFMNDYIDIYVKEDGKVYIEIGKINEEGIAISENTYANSSFATFMKYLNVEISDLSNEIGKYLAENELFLRIKRNEKTTNLDCNLHDISTKEELVSYNSFQEFVETEILQIENNL